jgi:hypothetical protein
VNSGTEGHIRKQVKKNRRFSFVQFFYEPLKAIRLFALVVFIKIRMNPFFPAAYLQEFVVQFNIPFAIQAEFFEGRVKGNAVAVAFGIDNDAVLIK